MPSHSTDTPHIRRSTSVTYPQLSSSPRQDTRTTPQQIRDQAEADYVHAIELTIATRVERLVQERTEEHLCLEQEAWEAYNHRAPTYTSAFWLWEIEHK